MELSIHALLQNRKIIVIAAVVLSLILLVGTSYLLFPEVRDGQPPVLKIEGIQENDRFYDAYEIRFSAEDKETSLASAEILVNNEQVYSSEISDTSFDGMAQILTADLPEGAHTLAVRVHDRALFSHKTEWSARFWIDRTPPKIETKMIAANIKQGDTLALYFNADEQLREPAVIFKTMKYPVDVVDEAEYIYVALIPVSVFSTVKKEPVLCQFSDVAGNRVEENLLVSVTAGTFEKERIEVPSGKVAIFSDKNAERRKTEGRIIAEAISTHSTLKFWYDKFIRPSEGVVSSSFASQRVYSTGSVASCHKGMDIANKTGTPIYAANYGKVIIAREFLVYGNTVIIDHGQGIVTLYGHMDYLVVQEGEYVTRNQQIGVMGDTGLATGPHLHWELRINGREANPVQWEETNFEHPWKTAF
ncbi:MAG: M23 family metallopeptidase [Spirochaetales bacterium]|nr:M23 family metallopeptidase [Spirochaetales bacterium]